MKTPFHRRCMEVARSRWAPAMTKTDAQAPELDNLEVLASPKLKKGRSWIVVQMVQKSKIILTALRTFALIATAHFFAHVTHTPCIADHQGKHDTKGANIFHKNGK